jgi:hypothetical protein
MQPSALTLSNVDQPADSPEFFRLAGPGWFESSWDLRRGLEVHESGEADARLRTWIDEYLGAQRACGSPSVAGASFSAT